MQAIAAENNVAETAFFVKTGPGAYDLRWFAPEREVDLCGHATLASAWTLYSLLGETAPQLRFATRSGELVVGKAENGLTMSLPSAPSKPFEAPAGFRQALGTSMGATPTELHISDKAARLPRPDRGLDSPER